MTVTWFLGISGVTNVLQQRHPKENCVNNSLSTFSVVFKSKLKGNLCIKGSSLMLVIFDCLFFSEIFKRIKHFLSGRQKSTRHSLRFNLIRNILSALLLNPHQKNEPRWRSYLLTQLLNQIKRKKFLKKTNDSSRIFFWATKYKRVNWLELNLNS